MVSASRSTARTTGELGAASMTATCRRSASVTAGSAPRERPGPDGRPDFENERFVYLGDQANMPYGNYAAAVLNLGVLYDLYLWDPKRAAEHYDRYLAMTPGGDATVTKWLADLKNRKPATAAAAASKPAASTASRNLASQRYESAYVSSTT